jgi:hypothetical protein
MSASTKTLLATIFFALYGPFLIYLYAFPQEVAVLGIGHPLRKAFILDRNLAPTFFTIGMGIFFTIIASVGAYKFVTASDEV